MHIHIDNTCIYSLIRTGNLGAEYPASMVNYTIGSMHAPSAWELWEGHFLFIPPADYLLRTRLPSKESQRNRYYQDECTDWTAPPTTERLVPKAIARTANIPLATT